MAIQSGGMTITIDHKEVSKTLDFTKRKVAEAMAESWRDMANQVRVRGRQELRNNLHLKTKFIPDSLITYPYTQGHVEQQAKSLQKFGNIQGRLFYRHATKAKYNLGYMETHDKSMKLNKRRTGQHTFMTTPAHGRENEFRTGRGATKKNMKPEYLIRHQRTFQKTGRRPKGRRQSGYSQWFEARKDKSSKGIIARWTRVGRKLNGKLDIAYYRNYNYRVPSRVDLHGVTLRTVVDRVPQLAARVQRNLDNNLNLLPKR